MGSVGFGVTKGARGDVWWKHASLSHGRDQERAGEGRAIETSGPVLGGIQIGFSGIVGGDMFQRGRGQPGGRGGSTWGLGREPWGQVLSR